MAVAQAKTMISGLPRRFVMDGILTQDDVLRLTQSAKENKNQFIHEMVSSGAVPPDIAATIAAEEFGLPVFDLDVLSRDIVPMERFDAEASEKLWAVPVRETSSRLYIAISDPTNLRALDEFQHKHSIATEAIIVEDNKLQRLIDQLVERNDAIDLDGDFGEDLDNLEVANESEDDDPNETGDETPVVRFVNKMLLDAIKKGASDIHFEPYEKFVRVRYRVDGVLKEMAKPPLQLASKIVARVKVMSQMDISERRVPQDGRIKLKVSKKRSIDFRVNTCPTLFGEKIVLRILDPSSAMLGIDVLGYEPDQKELFLKALDQPQGMILVTGPTGSGKTVSLYTGLNILNTPERNISTAEDPAEINLPGINQVNVNLKAGLTFAEALKSFLRQDPDIIMVGEIRDKETASIAVKAAQTGHLVLSTLHTNDAPQTLSRLMNIGIAPFDIASAVSLVIAQRLGRRLCDNCKEPDNDITPDILIKEGFLKTDFEEEWTLYRPVGCSKCADGYKGRVGIYQVMPMSESMGRTIMEGGNAGNIADIAAENGVRDLRRSALMKVIQGMTSLEEANRITRD